jgi:hypothetical protein
VAPLVLAVLAGCRDDAAELSERTTVTVIVSDTENGIANRTGTNAGDPAMSATRDR